MADNNQPVWILALVAVVGIVAIVMMASEGSDLPQGNLGGAATGKCTYVGTVTREATTVCRGNVCPQAETTQTITEDVIDCGGTYIVK